MYEVILENATGRMSFRFDKKDDADSFCLVFAKSRPHPGDRRSYRVYDKKNKMVDHEEFV